MNDEVRSAKYEMRITKCEGQKIEIVETGHALSPEVGNGKWELGNEYKRGGMRSDEIEIVLTPIFGKERVISNSER